MTDDGRQVLAAFDDLDRALERRDRAAVEALWVTDEDLTFWGSAGRTHHGWKPTALDVGFADGGRVDA